MPTTYVNFHANITKHTTQNLMTALAQKMAAGTDHFYILLSTPGGEVQSGLTVYNFLRAIPARITMHNIGNVDSIGVGFDVQNLRVEEKAARELLHGILADQTRIADIIVERTGIHRHRSRKLFREASTKNSTDALGTGIIQRIVDPNIPAGADVMSFVFQP